LKILILQGETPISTLSAMDRGLNYGDGLFETLLTVNGNIPWWPEHWQRLSAGAERLGIVLPSQEVLFRAAEGLLTQPRQVLKIVVTRGVSGRGYAPGDGPATSVLSTNPVPDRTSRALQLHWCNTRVSENAALAGIKHLNRLDNVLARAECQKNGSDDGLMCDSQNRVVCATAANVFIYRNGIWATPPVLNSGIAGIARARLLGMLGNARIEPLTREHVHSADAVVLCNAVRGIMGVERIGEHRFPAHPETAELERQFKALNPAFNDD